MPNQFSETIEYLMTHYKETLWDLSPSLILSEFVMDESLKTLPFEVQSENSLNNILEYFNRDPHIKFTIEVDPLPS